MRKKKEIIKKKLPKSRSKTVKKRVSKPRVPRTRNNNTMTDYAFFGWIRQVLRRASMYWKPIAQVRKEAQVPYHGTNTRRKYSYVCNDCKGEFAGKSINVHHNFEVGTLTCFEDLPAFVENLFCEKEFLVVLCTECHDKRHNKN